MKARTELDKALILLMEKFIDDGVVENETRFAKRLETNQSNLSKIRKGERSASHRILRNLTNEFGEYFDIVGFFVDERVIDGNIIFASDANAGSSIPVDYTFSPKFSIPGLAGEHFAFNVKGDSMFPTLIDGELLVCKKMDSSDSIKDNHVYVVSSNDGVNVKRVKIIRSDAFPDRNIRLDLISDNPEYKEILKVDNSTGLHSGFSADFYHIVKRLTDFY